MRYLHTISNFNFPGSLGSWACLMTSFPASGTTPKGLGSYIWHTASIRSLQKHQNVKLYNVNIQIKSLSLSLIILLILTALSLK